MGSYNVNILCVIPKMSRMKSRPANVKWAGHHREKRVPAPFYVTNLVSPLLLIPIGFYGVGVPNCQSNISVWRLFPTVSYFGLAGRTQLSFRPGK